MVLIYKKTCPQQITCQQENFLAIVALQMQIVKRKHAPIHSLAIARDPTLVQTSLGRWLHHPLLRLPDNVALYLVGVACGRLVRRRSRRDRSNGHCVRYRTSGWCCIVIAGIVERCRRRRCGCVVLLAETRNIAAGRKVHAMMHWWNATSYFCCCGNRIGEHLDRCAFLIFSACFEVWVVVVVLGRSG